MGTIWWKYCAQPNMKTTKKQYKLMLLKPKSDRTICTPSICLQPSVQWVHRKFLWKAISRHYFKLHIKFISNKTPCYKRPFKTWKQTYWHTVQLILTTIRLRIVFPQFNPQLKTVNLLLHAGLLWALTGGPPSTIRIYFLLNNLVKINATTVNM